MSAALARPAERRITLVQGECRVSSDPDLVLSTLLGSCVAVCLRDPVARVGGMNHFLLPGTDLSRDSSSLRYGAHAMALLVEALVAHGARRERLGAKLFGGGRVLAGLTDLGSRNADFAETYLCGLNITYLGGSLRGDRGRRVEFWPSCGRTRQLWVRPDAGVFAAERYHAQPVDFQHAGDRDA